LNDNLSSGIHSVVWNGKNDWGKDVASGVYFAKFSSNSEKTIVKKLMLLK
jgi:hypothetical protein